VTNTANWLVTERIRLTKAQVMELLAGNHVLIKTGRNIMGETLATKVVVRGEAEPGKARER